MGLSLWQRLGKLCNHHPGDLRFFLDPHCKHWKMKCQRRHIWQRKDWKTWSWSYATLKIPQMLLFRNKTITHINHAETHSNTWRIRMYNVTRCISLLSFRSIRMWLWCRRCSCVTHWIHLHFNNFVFLTFFLGNTCLKFWEQICSDAPTYPRTNYMYAQTVY